MSTSLSTLRTQVYAILREDEDTSSYPYTLVDLLINIAQQKICSGLVVNPFTGKEVKKGQLPFLNTDKFYSSVANTDLTADTTVGATTLYVTSTSDFSASGKLYIAGNIISYTGKTATTFTGVTNVLFAFLSGEQVSVVHTLPTDFASSINVVYNDRYQLECKPYDDIFEDLNSHKGNHYRGTDFNTPYTTPNYQNPFYTIKDNAYLIIFNIDNTGDKIRLRYEKKPTELSAGGDLATIDNDLYAKSTIAYLAVGETLYNRGEEQRGSELINFALGQIKEMYQYYNTTSYEKLNGQQVKMGKRRLNI